MGDQEDKQQKRPFRAAPACQFAMLCRFMTVAPAFYSIVCVLHAGILTPDNAHQFSRWRSLQSVLISMLGVVFSLLHRTEDRRISGAQLALEIYPGAVKRATHRARIFVFVRNERL